MTFPCRCRRSFFFRLLLFLCSALCEIERRELSENRNGRAVMFQYRDSVYIRGVFFMAKWFLFCVGMTDWAISAIAWPWFSVYFPSENNKTNRSESKQRENEMRQKRETMEMATDRMAETVDGRLLLLRIQSNANWSRWCPSTAGGNMEMRDGWAEWTHKNK